MDIKRLFIEYVYLFFTGFCVLNVSCLELNNAYTEYYLDDICFNNRKGEFFLESSGPEAAVKIKSSDSTPTFRHHRCVLHVQPPPFHGLVVQLFNGYSSSLVHHHCGNYIEIFSAGEVYEKFCNFSSDTGVSRILTTTEAMEVLVSINHSRKHKHVSMMFTAYDKRRYTCEPEKFQCSNSLCLWKGFVCDGENNCGDYSDEHEHGKSNCGIKTKEAMDDLETTF